MFVCMYVCFVLNIYFKYFLILSCSRFNFFFVIGVIILVWVLKKCMYIVNLVNDNLLFVVVNESLFVLFSVISNGFYFLLKIIYLYLFDVWLESVK